MLLASISKSNARKLLPNIIPNSTEESLTTEVEVEHVHDEVDVEQLTSSKINVAFAEIESKIKISTRVLFIDNPFF